MRALQRQSRYFLVVLAVTVEVTRIKYGAAKNGENPGCRDAVALDRGRPC
jgi:phage tail tube protein FII